jgi:hypothetical protein
MLGCRGREGRLSAAGKRAVRRARRRPAAARAVCTVTINALGRSGSPHLGRGAHRARLTRGFGGRAVFVLSWADPLALLSWKKKYWSTGPARKPFSAGTGPPPVCALPQKRAPQPSQKVSTTVSTQPQSHYPHDPGGGVWSSGAHTAPIPLPLEFQRGVWSYGRRPGVLRCRSCRPDVLPWQRQTRRPNGYA